MIKIRNKPATNEIVYLPQPAHPNNALTDALKQRQTTRQYAGDTLPQQMLSNILWAAQGSTGDNNHKTVPLAYGIDYLKIFVLTAEGAFDYQASTQSLSKLTGIDIRGTSGTQSFAATAPLSLVYALDNDRIKSLRKTCSADRTLYGHVSAGAACQNVALYAANAGLACGVRADINRKSLYKGLGLPRSVHIIIAQSIGFSA